jgi:AcrR family transcriptional regulator
MSTRPDEAALPATIERPAGRRRKAPPVVRHEDKRLAILRIAAQLFAQNGYEATSLDMIADQIGMHKATLYHYIKNKEEVLYFCLVKSFENLDEVVEKVRDRSEPPLQRLRYFAQSLAHAQNSDFGRCLVVVGLRPLTTEASLDIRRFQRRLDTTVRDLITEGIAAGDIKPCVPALLSAMLFGMLNWVPQWYQEDGKYSIDEVVETFMNMLIQGIAAKPQR